MNILVSSLFLQFLNSFVFLSFVQFTYSFVWAHNWIWSLKCLWHFNVFMSFKMSVGGLCMCVCVLYVHSYDMNACVWCRIVCQDWIRVHCRRRQSATLCCHALIAQWHSHLCRRLPCRLLQCPWTDHISLMRSVMLHYIVSHSADTVRYQASLACWFCVIYCCIVYFLWVDCFLCNMLHCWTHVHDCVAASHGGIITPMTIFLKDQNKYPVHGLIMIIQQFLQLEKNKKCSVI